MDPRPTRPSGQAVTRRYSDREIALILTRTAELQTTRAAESEVSAGLSQEELEQIAREAGLDPRYVRSAIAELDAGRGTRQSRWLGGTTWIQLERSVSGELAPREHDALVEIIHRTLGEVGQPSVLGRTLRWIALTGMTGRHAHGREIEVAIATRDGQTTIRIHERLRALATSLFAGIVIGGGTSGAVLAGALGAALFATPIAPVLFVAGAVGGSYGLARGIFGHKSRSRAAQLRTLIDLLADHISATAVSPAVAPGSAARAIPDAQGTEGRGGSSPR